MPKGCDACQSSSAVVYCRADAAYLCRSCDGQVHGANKLASRHERVWMCEVCEAAPAVVTCKADAASLCEACDTDIHSANPLAQRHERVPVTPLVEAVAASPSSSPSPSPGAFEVVPSNTQVGLLKDDDDEDTDAVSSWLLPHPSKVPAHAIIRGSAAASEAPRSSVVCPFSPAKVMKVQKLETLADIFSDVDPFLDLDDGAVTGMQPDSLVPECSEETASLMHSVEPSFSTDAGFPLKGENVHNSSYSYGTSTLTHSLSCSSLDAAVVPDSSVSDISTQYAESRGSLELGARVGGQQPQQQQQQPCGGGALDVVDREARVMRYKEKRQKRRFEKTIRYASRKAYAESRPRIKGRFAKRTDSDMEQAFGSVDSGFGVVPSF